MFGLGGRRLLVVEDNADCAGAVRAWLEICGARVDTAGSVGSALRHVRSEHPPDLVLLDVRLPDGSGWDLLDRVRETMPGAAIPVVAITGLEGAAVEEAAHAHGVRHVLTKPIAPAALAEALSACLDA